MDRRRHFLGESKSPDSMSYLQLSNMLSLQKNVYSVFRFNPPSVGFANLSTTATSESGGDAPVPSATIGSVVAVSATGTGKNRASDAASPAHSLSAFAAIIAGSIVLGGLLI